MSFTRTEITMNSKLQWKTEIILIFLLNQLLDFGFLPIYYDLYGYIKPETTYSFSLEKKIIALFLLFLFVLILHISAKHIYKVSFFIVRAFYWLSLIPMLSVYTCSSTINIEDIVPPSIFWVLFIVFISNNIKINLNDDKTRTLNIPTIKNLDLIILGFSCIATIIIWVYSGRPIFFDFSDAYTQRMLLRENAFPIYVNYVFMILGGSVLPFMFAKFYIKRKYLLSFAILTCGLLLFFVNGMKTWLYFYILFFFVSYLYNRFKTNYADISLRIEVICLVVFCGAIMLYIYYENRTLLAQAGRIFILPNLIGFKAVSFFSDNELLYLRESFLRFVFNSPYPGGSDFYMNFGSDFTITSTRTNNGLWGDAYRNFGLVGMFIYPFLIGSVYKLFCTITNFEDKKLQLFLIFMFIWSSINTPFFIWLVTGGVICVSLIEKIYKKNKQYIDHV